MGVIRDPTNEQLLRMSYRDPDNIKSFLRNWAGLERLCDKGDSVALCILADLKVVTGIDLEAYKPNRRMAFNKRYMRGKLSFNQYMCITYNLVLGYSQSEVAFVLNVERSVVSRHIKNGIKTIQRELKAFSGHD